MRRIIEYCLVSADGIVLDDPFPFHDYQDDAYLRDVLEIAAAIRLREEIKSEWLLILAGLAQSRHSGKDNLTSMFSDGAQRRRCRQLQCQSVGHLRASLVWCTTRRPVRPQGPYRPERKSHRLRALPLSF